MLFNSLEFAVFFALVLCVHQFAPLPWAWRKGVLVLASYAFYAAWSAPFTLLLAFSTLIDWLAARAIGRAATGRARRGWLMVSLVSNLGLLGFFKYGGFLLGNLGAAAALAGSSWTPGAMDIVLPVGISFYTFQTLSYTIDVYRGSLEPDASLLDFSLFVAFFPQLVAGPIVRASDFLVQCRSPRRGDARMVGWGASLLLFGLVLKVALADGLLAPTVDAVFERTGGFSTADAWVGALGFTGQIYCDFAGYSLCGIGAALCLGFSLPDNFHFPFAATGFSDFWKRWHISLSTWLRDYLYIPLGGNRGGPRRTLINLSLTMLLGGLWHGADWRFVIWGALHALYLVVERACAPFVAGRPWSASPAARAAWGGATFAGVVVAFVLFRAESISRALLLFHRMGGLSTSGGFLGAPEQFLVVAVVGALVAGSVALRNTTLEAAWSRLPSPVAAAILGAALAALVLSPAEDRAFLYFQF